MPHVPTQCARVARQRMHVHAHGPSQVRCRGLLTHAAHIARALSGELTARSSAGPEIAQAEEAEQLLRGPGNNRLAAAACTPPGACPAASCAAASQCACMAPVPLQPAAPSWRLLPGMLTVSCQARAVLPALPPIHPPPPIPPPPTHTRQATCSWRACCRCARCVASTPLWPPSWGWRLQTWQTWTPGCWWVAPGCAKVCLAACVVCLWGWWGWGVPGGGGHMAVLAD